MFRWLAIAYIFAVLVVSAKAKSEKEANSAVQAASLSNMDIDHQAKQ